DQNTSDMTLYSKKIFGEIIDENFTKAKEILATRDNIKEEEEILTYEDIKGYMKKFNHIYDIKVKIVEADSSARFTMKGDVLMFRKGATVGKREMRSIIAHEIEGHYLRKVNGRKSEFSILSRGTAGYIETDEGLAIYNQSRFVNQYDRKYYSIFERYYFIQYALKHSYKKLVKHLADFYDNDYERVFTFMLRVKRGFEDPSKEGVFMKDVVYTNGYFSVTDYIEAGGSLQDLYIGKIHLDDLAIISGNSSFTKHKKDVVIPFSV
ncbi:flavohemoglobin expression-modulating QEGLA motif protein, partial [Candidatus Gracilibacteria bacterium]|nr:flavohemoglobin expression-modulating QEGLA motif protein [Candidatus Gracilibacteria bacterium]